MHLYVLVRGHKDKQDRWVNDLLAQYYPFKHAKDQPEGLLQLGVRPVQMYELAFPEPMLKEVVRTVNPFGGYMSKSCIFLRKLMGLQPLKLTCKDVEHLPKRVFTQDWVSVSAIGIKKDHYNKDGIESI